MNAKDRDIRKGFKHFLRWADRFVASAYQLRGRHLQDFDDIIYLASQIQMEGQFGEFPEGVIDDVQSDIEYALEQKIAFLKAYIAVLATESQNYVSDVRNLLKWQTRAEAPHLLGFWFWQSDPGNFGSGTSSFFQGDEISIFCERMTQIDFSDICAIVPCDRITIRRPKSDWSESKAQRIVDHIVEDLAYDGLETKLKMVYHKKMLYITICSPDYGIR